MLALALCLRYDAPVATAHVSVTEVVDIRTAKRLVDGFAGGTVRALDELLPDALGGRRQAVRGYVEEYRALTDQVLGAVRDARPDLVVIRDDVFWVVDAKREISKFGTTVFQRAAIDAPFSPWVELVGGGYGVALELVSRVRSALITLDPLPLPKGKSALPDWRLDDLAVRRFTRLVIQALDEDEPPLRRIVDTFGLTTSELGRLFGVSRQAAAQWLEQGAPPARQGKVVTVAEIADVLGRRLKGPRLAGIVRRGAESFDGASMLELIADNQEDRVLESVRKSFEYATTA
jgi:hypothetical protein